MSSGHSPQVKFEIGHVLFIDCRLLEVAYQRAEWADSNVEAVCSRSGTGSSGRSASEIASRHTI